ncbi:MAG TPA: hypothetical protein VGJ44_19660 [Kribbellaceae bacterium]
MARSTSNEMESIDAIARALIDALPEGWRSVTSVYRATAPYAELDATYAGADGTVAQVDPLPEGLEEYFEALRLQMYQPGKGAWLTASVTITSEGRFSTDFDYDSEPAWSIDVDPATYAADLAEFPREPRYLPDWMRARIR